MIRFFESFLRKNARCAVHNLNQALGRAASAQEPHSSQGPSRGPRHDADRQSAGRGAGAERPLHCWGPGGLRPGLPSALCLGTVVAAGLHLSRIASELWHGAQERPSPLLRFLTGADQRTVTGAFCVRDQPRRRKRRRPDHEDGIAAALNVASELDACDRLNREGAAHAERGDWALAVPRFQCAAAQGFPPAQFNLGLFHHTVGRDLDQAKALYERAAANGHGEAAFNLSTILLERDSPDWEAAMQRAAELGLGAAQVYLGGHYFAACRYAQARTYFSRARAAAASSGPEEVQRCCYWIGRCHEAEGGLWLAELWYRQAAAGPPGELGVDASARSSQLGLRRCPARALLHSASDAALREAAEDRAPAMPGSPVAVKGEEDTLPLFFVPPSPGEMDDDVGGDPGDFVGTAGAVQILAREPMRRSRSAAKLLD